MFAILALTASFSAPDSAKPLALRGGGGAPDSAKPLALRGGGGVPPKLLALRGGGISTDHLYNTMLVLNGVTGLQGWIAPQSTIEAYGITKDLSAQESFCLRVTCGMAFVLAATMLAAENSVVAMTSTCWLAWALSTTANIPLFETMDVPKGATVGFAAVFGVIGELTRRGKLDIGLSTNILSFMLIGVSIAEIVAPQAVFDSFKMGTPSALSKRLFENFDFTKVATGLFVLTTKMTGKKGLGLAAAAAAVVVNCIKAIATDQSGISKPALGGWAVISGAISLLAFMNEKA